MIGKLVLKFFIEVTKEWKPVRKSTMQNEQKILREFRWFFLAIQHSNFFEDLGMAASFLLLPDLFRKHLWWNSFIFLVKFKAEQIFTEHLLDNCFCINLDLAKILYFNADDKQIKILVLVFLSWFSKHWENRLPLLSHRFLSAMNLYYYYMHHNTHSKIWEAIYRKNLILKYN